MSNTETKSSSIGTRVAGFFKGVRVEFQKIIWPSRDTLLKQLVAVLAVAVILGGIIALLDFGFQSLFDLLMGLSISG